MKIAKRFTIKCETIQQSEIQYEMNDHGVIVCDTHTHTQKVILHNHFRLFCFLHFLLLGMIICSLYTVTTLRSDSWFFFFFFILHLC